MVVIINVNNYYAAAAIVVDEKLPAASRSGLISLTEKWPIQGMLTNRVQDLRKSYTKMSGQESKQLTGGNIDAKY